MLGGPDQKPVVLGRPKKPLPPVKYLVVKTLLEAGEAGLSKPDLEARTGKAEAVKHLRLLRDSDDDWKAVIVMAGSPGNRYRIRHE